MMTLHNITRFFSVYHLQEPSLTGGSTRIEQTTQRAGSTGACDV